MYVRMYVPICGCSSTYIQCRPPPLPPMTTCYVHVTIVWLSTCQLHSTKHFCTKATFSWSLEWRLYTGSTVFMYIHVCPHAYVHVVHTTLGWLCAKEDKYIHVSVSVHQSVSLVAASSSTVGSGSSSWNHTSRWRDWGHRVENEWLGQWWEHGDRSGKSEKY